MKKILPIFFILFCISLYQSTSLAKPITKPSERAVIHNNQGIKYLDARDLTRAEIEFKTAVELSPDYIEPYNNLGIIAKLRGDLPTAKAFFEKAIKLDKNYAAAYSHLSMVYLDMGDLNNALAFGKKAVKVGSTLPNTHFNLALVYIEKVRKNPKDNSNDDAEKELKIATELNPNMYEAHLTLARLYNRLGKYDLAAIRYRLALENKPGDPKVWRELAEVYRMTGETAKADITMKKAESVARGEKEMPSQRIELGIKYMKQKEFTKAIEEFKSAVAENPNSDIANYKLGSAYLTIGEVYFSQDKKDEAFINFKSSIEPLLRASQLNPKLIDASYNLGLVFFRLNKQEAAISIWNQVLEQNPDHAGALYNLGMLYNQTKDQQKAIGYLCRFASIATKELASEKANALEVVKVNGGKCQN